LSPVLAPCHDEISFETVVICVGLVRIHVKETEQDHADDKVDEVQPHVKIGISIDENANIHIILMLKLNCD
jgi:hypothetical protein